MNEDVAWRQISGGYEISSEGFVRNPSGKILVGRTHTNGYIRVSLPFAADAYVHRLVCTAFHGDPPFEGAQVDHCNLCRSDNRAENLRWVSKEKNLAQRRIPKGERHANARLCASDIVAIRSAQLAHMNNRQLSAWFSVSRETIRDVRLRKVWKHVA